jgi:hypothetical protein
MPKLVGYTENRTLRKAKHLAPVKEAPVLPRVVEPSCGSQRLRTRAAGGRNELLTGYRNSEALAALSAAALEDVFTVGGQHAFAETVTATALGTTGLECAFHKIYNLGLN